MRAEIDLESIWNAVTVEDVMQLPGVDAQSVLIYVLLNLPVSGAISRYSGGGKIIASRSTASRFPGI